MLKKILLLGTSGGSYRNQNTIRFFTDRLSEYAIVYMDNRYSTIQFQCKSIICKVFKKLLNYCIKLFSIPAYTVRVFHAKQVFILGMNHNDFLIEILIAKLLGKRIIIDFYISMYDTLVLDRKSIKNKWLAKKLFYKEQLIMKLADELIFLNHAEQKYYCDLLRVTTTKFKIIPLCIDPHRYRESGLLLDRKQTPIICWWGTYIPLHGLFNIIEAVELLKHRGFQGKFYIFGNSEVAAKQYQEKIVEKGLENEITIVNDYTFNNGKLEQFLYEKCDLALGSFGESEKAKTVLINKVVDAISMNIPILTMKTKALEEFFNFEDDIFVTQTGNPDEIAEEILYVFNNYEKLKRNIEKSYQIYLDNFSPKVYMKKLEEVVSDS
jgi:glycosyltransferase involved in cell wall biosynthesis